MEDVKEALQRELEEQDVISASITAPVHGGGGVEEEEELARELQALEEEMAAPAATAIDTAQRLIDSMPDVSKLKLSDPGAQSRRKASSTSAPLPVPANP